nr:hypothetical protein [Collinsella vaginalis]
MAGEGAGELTVPFFRDRVATGADRRGRRVGQAVEIGLGNRAEVDEIARGEAGHAEAGTKHASHLRRRLRLADSTAERGVDDRRRPAAVDDQEVATGHQRPAFA